MKKIMLVAILLMAMGRAMAQEGKRHELGVHFGVSSLDVEYHYVFSSRNYLMVTAGVFTEDAWPMFQGQYCWNVKLWERNRVIWKFSGGIGGAVGEYDGLPFVGPAGVIGFGLMLKKVPLTLGADFRPMTGLVFGDGLDVLDVGFLNFGVTLSGRF